MMGFLGWIISALATGVPLWRLLPGAGMSPALALLSIIPILGLVVLWVIAFRRWPGDDVSGRFE